MNLAIKIAGVYTGCAAVSAAYCGVGPSHSSENIKVLTHGISYETTIKHKKSAFTFGYGEEITNPTTAQRVTAGAAAGLFVPSVIALIPPIAVSSMIFK